MKKPTFPVLNIALLMLRNVPVKKSRTTGVKQKFQRRVGHAHRLLSVIWSLPNNVARFSEKHRVRNNAAVSAYIIKVLVVRGRHLFGDSSDHKIHESRGR
jgi:hypothetical protein